MTYTRLTKTEREHIGAGLAEGKDPMEIANELGRHPSSISREIRRNCVKQERYSVLRALERSESLAGSKHSGGKLEKKPLLRDIVGEGSYH
ncbi:MAG: helix-turn-helix domain-containing protein [Ignavibacteriae bacterium]|nr:helix-turn-helix domain-containing protein [Ignavibacteriota bacterium]